MIRPLFETNGQLGAWLESSDVTIVDPPAGLFDYDPDALEPTGVESHPLREVVDFIATHIASLPLKVYKRLPDGGRERVRTGPLAELLANPSGNPAISPYAFWLSLITDGLLADRYLAVQVEGHDGAPHLKRIPPRRWSVTSDDFDEITGVKVQIAGQTSKYDIHKDTILLGVGYSYAGAKGSPKRARLKDVLKEYEASVEYRRNINKRGIQAPLVIERDRP